MFLKAFSCFIFGGLIFFSAPIFGQHATIDFSRPIVVAVDNIGSNLAFESEGTIYQDSAGFTWIPTAKGALRYDGSALNRFDLIGEDGLASDYYLNNFYEGKDGIFWVATLDAGLLKVDLNSGEYKKYSYEESDRSTVSANL